MNAGSTLKLIGTYSPNTLNMVVTYNVKIDDKLVDLLTLVRFNNKIYFNKWGTFDDYTPA